VAQEDISIVHERAKSASFLIKRLLFLRVGKEVPPFLPFKPTPDWKGGVAVAARQWRGKGPPEPWKAGLHTKAGPEKRKEKNSEERTENFIITFYLRNKLRPIPSGREPWGQQEN
jgi:hypothetical protein